MIGFVKRVNIVSVQPGIVIVRHEQIGAYGGKMDKLCYGWVV